MSASSTIRFPKLNHDDFRPLPVQRLAIDETLRFPIHSSDGILLLSAGSVLTPRAVEALRLRGFQTVLVHREEAAADLPFVARGSAEEPLPPRPGSRVNLDTRSSRSLDQRLSATIEQSLSETEPPLLPSIPVPANVPYEVSLSRELRTTHEQFVSSLRWTLSSLLNGEGSGASKTRSLIDSYLQLMVRDLDLFTALAGAPDLGHYPHRHGLHVAMLSLSMGARAGLGPKALSHLALGALLHDIGMLRLPRSMLLQKEPLSVAQYLEVMQHPIHSIEALSGNAAIHDDVRCICYQVHERAGGQGYPRRTPDAMIHPLAKIVSVADAYVAMISERPYRKAMLPYMALETMIRLANQGWFSPDTVRLLLQTLSLYPIGSYIALSDGRLAKVLRSCGEVYHRPVVRIWPHDTEPTDESGEIVGLVDYPHLEVLAALPAPPLSA